MSITGAGTSGDADADLEANLADWRRFRRQARLADVHWIDALYQAYLAALLSAVAILGGAGIVGDEPVSASGLADVRAHGAAWVGCVVALVIGLGLRSGSHGGPLVLDRADVRHVLLSPVDRITALRSPLLHQLRFLSFAAAVAGATAGHLADRRLPGNGGAWTACGALAGAAAVVLAHGLACCAAGLRLRPWLAALLALGLLGWSAADALGEVPSAPGTVLGDVALWALDFEPVALVALAAAVIAVAVGLRVVGNLSLEQLERRSRLVGQLRFAATLQDLRTVVVLRRQLTQERARNRPWLRPPLPSRRLPVLTRDVRSLLRWPLGRIARLVLLGVVAGLAARGAWEGTSPLVIVAGLALFLAGLDATEPLGQELDHPSRRDAVPVPSGWLYVRHLPSAVVVGLFVAGVAAVAAVLVDPEPGAWALAAACVVPAALGAASGAAVNLIMGAPEVATTAWNLAPPEAAGVRLVFRSAWPPAMAVVGVTPVLFARAAFERGDPTVEAATAGIPVLVMLFSLVCGWARVRDDIKRWWAAQVEQSMGKQTTA